MMRYAKRFAVLVVGLVLCSCSSLRREATRGDGRFILTGEAAYVYDVLMLPEGPPIALP
jgi:hypothetical protein